MAVVPTLELENELFATGCKFVAGVDEVGRGALAGPVTIAIAVIDANSSEVPKGLRDSKLISKATRERLIPEVEDWVVAAQIASATAEEIDDIGITAALRLAFHRALAQLPITPDHIILDGKHNWIASRADDLFSSYESCVIPVTTKIKADATCGSVAAASVLAKVSRDTYMNELSDQHPEFGWASNVGYGAAEHMAAIIEHGPTVFHRRSWNLPKA